MFSSSNQKKKRKEKKMVTHTYFKILGKRIWCNEFTNCNDIVEKVTMGWKGRIYSCQAVAVNLV